MLNTHHADAAPSFQAKTPATTAQLKSWVAYAFMLGGALLIAMYIVELYVGSTTGLMPYEGANAATIFGWFTGIAFSSGLALIGAALAGLAFWLRQHRSKLATSALVVASIAAVPSSVNAVLATNIFGPGLGFPPINALSVLLSLTSATLLGFAGMRTGAVSRRVSWTLVVVGLVTFPLILLTIPMESIFPVYVVQDFPFPIWGAIFAAIGASLGRGRGTNAAS